MKHKVSELEGPLLDVAVAKAEGLKFSIGREKYIVPFTNKRGATSYRDYDESPSTDWVHGGPIIDREGIGLYRQSGGQWIAGDLYCWDAYGEAQIETHGHSGSTPLVAAMRAYVAAKLGEEVELP